MPAIQYPTMNVKYFAITPVYIRADDDTVNQYCTDNGYTLVSYKKEAKRFSNDDGLEYQYYDTTDSVWRSEFGYAQIVSELIYS